MRDGPDSGVVVIVTEDEENGGAKCVCDGYREGEGEGKRRRVGQVQIVPCALER